MILHQKGLTRLEISVIVVIILAASGVVSAFLSHYRGLDRAVALDNAKTIAAGLMAFKTEMGQYPCDATKEKLRSDGYYKKTFEGTDANAYLAQLICIDIIDDQGVFYAPGIERPIIYGDSIKGSSSGPIFEPGENAFAYVMTTEGRALNDVTNKAPLVLAHLKSGGTNPTFVEKTFHGKGVAGLVDGSGMIFEIDDKGHAISKDGKALFATGADSLFGKETPLVVGPTKP